MCGITAFFSRDKCISAEKLKRATNSLHHRGPDSQGAWLSPNQRVGLGHTRLSIIDLTTGDQPIANEDDRLHIVVNGEFYDFERQRHELEQRGHLFQTRSDSRCTQCAPNSSYRCNAISLAACALLKLATRFSKRRFER